MGGRLSTPPVTEREMMDLSAFQTPSSGSEESQKYPEHLDDFQVLTGKSRENRGAKFYRNIIGDIMKLNVRSSDSASVSSSDDSPRYLEGTDTGVSSEPSPKLRFHSTPKNIRPTSCDARFLNSAFRDGPPNSGESGDSGLPSQCGCEADDCSSCEIIVTKHESVVSRRIVTPSRFSRTFDSSEVVAEHRPKWKIEVEMESTRVIHNAMEREPGDLFLSGTSFSPTNTKRDTKDESTETEDSFVQTNGDDTTKDSHSLSSDEIKNKKKSFWSKKKKRKNTLQRDQSLTSMQSQNSSTISRHWKLWPFARHNGFSHANSNTKYKQSIYDEKMRYLQVAARVTRLRTVDVRATLLVETPLNRLTHAQLATKTHLLSVTLNAFFHPYPNIYVEWIESVADIIQERLELGDIMPKFAEEEEMEHCKVCLVLSPDASVLLCKPNCSLIHDIANIAGYPVKNTFVMEATESRESRPSTPGSSTASEPFAPIDEQEESEEGNDEDRGIGEPMPVQNGHD